MLVSQGPSPLSLYWENGLPFYPVCVCVCVLKGGVKGNNSLIDVSHHTTRFYSPELISTDQPNVLDVVT